MQLKNILKRSRKCVTDTDAASLLSKLQAEFGNTPWFRPMCILNAEAWMEDAAPFIRFELSHVISGYYVIAIVPELRDHALTLNIAAQYMEDGLGLSSQNWETIEDMEKLLEFPGQDLGAISVSVMAREAAKYAIAYHQDLMERVGISPKAASRTAKIAWHHQARD